MFFFDNAFFFLKKNLTAVTNCDNRFITDGEDGANRRHGKYGGKAKVGGTGSYLYGIFDNWILPVTWGRSNTTSIHSPFQTFLVVNKRVAAGKVKCHAQRRDRYNG